jgi:serine/threonine protein kinase
MSPDTSAAIVESCPHCGQLLDVSMMVPLAVVACPSCGHSATVLRQLGPFQIEKLLGHGGMGAVYQARDQGLQRSVALKVLQRSLSHDRKLTAGFEREAAMTAKINHPNVVRVFSTGTASGMFYIAMELVDQGCLDSWMSKNHRLPEEEVLKIGIQVTLGLQAAYRAGLIHRDIKPANILFAEKRLAKIVDFGLALPSSDASKGGDEIWGTPQYIAPESLAGKQEDFRSDLYSLAATLWHALAGTPPHASEGTSIEELLEARKVPADLARVAPWLHPKTVHILNQAVAFEPQGRQASYEVFLRELKEAQISLHPTGDQPPPTLSPYAQLWKTALAAGLCFGIGTSLFLWNRKKHSPPPLPPEVAQTTDESRLHTAHQLLAAGYPEHAAHLLDLILRAPGVSPKVSGWSTFSLAAAHLLQNQKSQSVALLENLAKIEIPTDLPLALFLRSLQGVPGATKRRPDEDPARKACRLLWSALLHLQSQKWKEASEDLHACASVDHAAQGDPNAQSFLLLTKPLLRELEQHQTILSVLGTLPSSPELISPMGECLTRLQELRVTQLLRDDAQRRISSARAAGARPAPDPSQVSSGSTANDNASRPADPRVSQRLETLRKTTSELIAFYRFDAATKAVAEFLTEFPTETIRANAFLHHIRSCKSLFEWAQQEIGRRTAPMPFPTLRGGNVFPARPIHADAERILLQTESGGTASFGWKDVSPVFLLTLANQRLANIPTPTGRGDLLWSAGNYQLALGATEKGLTTLRQAAELNSRYFSALQILQSLPGW